MPGSPEISTIWPSPSWRTQRRKSSSISSSRPTSRVSADPATPQSGSRRCRTQYLPDRHRRSDPQLDGAEIAVLEEIADQPARARGDDDSIRLGQGLQTGGDASALADDRCSCADPSPIRITDDHQPGGDPDALAA
jgi:hypothetical protein